jgi:RNA polymerase sigma-70 factor (ECF subfamily)
VLAFEQGDFDAFVSMLAEDAILSMPPWLYWLEGKEAVVASLRSPGTWEGELRAGRYRVVPTAMNGQPAALSYLRVPERDGRGPAARYSAICLTVMALDPQGRIAELAVFARPELFAAFGIPSTVEAG